MKSTLGGKMPYKRRCRWSRKASTENSMVSNWINVKTYKLTERIFLGTNNHSIWGAGWLGAKYLYSSLTFIFGFWVWGSFFSGSKSLGDYCWRFLCLQFADNLPEFRQFWEGWYVEPLFWSRAILLHRSLFLEKSNHFGLNLSLKKTNIRIYIFQVRDLKLVVTYWASPCIMLWTCSSL